MRPLVLRVLLRRRMPVFGLTVVVLRRFLRKAEDRRRKHQCRDHHCCERELSCAFQLLTYGFCSWLSERSSSVSKFAYRSRFWSKSFKSETAVPRCWVADATVSFCFAPV